MQFFKKRKSKKGDEEEKAFEDLNSEEQEMIRGIFELSDTTVKEIMVPRIDVVFISKDMDKKEIIETIIDCRHSRFPVYDKTIDNVIGILYAKDLLQFVINEKSFDIEKLTRKAYFIPESKRIDSLLREMKKRRVHIAISVDEYGGVSGIVSMEDILEEIIGDIQDEFDNEREDIIPLGQHAYLCDARVNLEDLNEELKIDLPQDDFETLGGFVFDLFGRIPVRYEKVIYEKLTFIIQEMDGHKILSVKIIMNQEGESKAREE